MADEAITEGEQFGVWALDPQVPDQWPRGQAEPTAHASWPATTSLPPSWWQQRASAHDLKHAHKRGQRNLL